MPGIIHSCRQTDISKSTSMTLEDVYNTLVQQNMIVNQPSTLLPVRPPPGHSIKFPRGRKNGIARRHLQRTNTQKEEDGSKPGSPVTLPTRYEISWDQTMVDEWLDNWEKKGYLKIKPARLKWTPFLLTRTRATGEILQSEPGIGLGAISSTAATPALSLEDSTSAAVDNSDREKSLTSGIGEFVNTEDSGTAAARLFDDMLIDAASTPKKHSRSGLKGASTPRPRSDRGKNDLHTFPLRQTRSSLRLVIDEDVQTRETDVQSSAECTPNGKHDDSVVPAKRPHGRPTRTRRLTSPPSALEPTPDTTSPPPPPSPRPVSLRKRRRVDFPSRSGSPSLSEPPDETADEQCVHKPVHRPNHDTLLINGQACQSNGIHRHPNSPQQCVAPDEKDARQFHGIAVSRENHYPDGPNGLGYPEVKAEDVSTPLTGSISAPSDNTLVAANEVNGLALHNKTSIEVGRPVILPYPMDQHPVQHMVGVNPLDVHDSDLDAEGDTDDEACM